MRLVSTKMGILVDRRFKIKVVSMEMGILVDRRFKIKVVSMKRAVFVDRRHPPLLAAHFKNSLQIY